MDSISTMPVLGSYYSFMMRDQRGDQVTTILDIYPLETAMPHVLIWSLIFIALSSAGDLLVPLLCPLYYQRLEDKKRKEMSSYITSTIHHVYVVGYGAWTIYMDMQRPPSDYDYDYKLNMMQFIPVVSGYLFSDIVYCAIPDFLNGKMDTIGHHILGVAICFSAFLLNSSIARFIPHLLICESSSLVFNLAWIFKSMGQKDTSIVITLEYLFAVLFTLLRVIHMPAVIASCWMFAQSVEVKWVLMVLLVPIYLLQVYWFFAILRALKKKEKAREDKKA